MVLERATPERKEVVPMDDKDFWLSLVKCIIPVVITLIKKDKKKELSKKEKF